MQDNYGIANLLLAGASKAGTSSLFSYLSQHPEICPSDIKEVRYFDGLRYGHAIDPVDVYRSHWERHGSERYFLEGTPGYLYGSRAMVEEIKRVCPDDTKVVVSLREPVDRMWSYYRFVRNRTRISKSMTFHEYVDACASESAYSADPDSPYRALYGGCYAHYLSNWFDLFGDNVKIIFFDDLVHDPLAVYADILKFLDLPYGQVDLTAENVTSGFRVWWLQRIAVKANRRGSRHLSRLPRLKRFLRTTYYQVNKGSMPTQMPADVEAELREFYTEPNHALSVMLGNRGVQMPAWCREAEFDLH